MKKRIFYLDFLRSFAMIMVLVLHSISSYIMQPGLFGTKSWYADLFINAFARTGVPIFFMISGSLLLSSDNTENFGRFYKKSLMHIVVPLAFWNVAYFIYKCIRGYIDFNIIILLSDFINCGSEYHLWYLYTLVGIYLIAPFLKILVNNCSMRQLIWLLFLMMIGTTIRPFINLVTPLYIYLFEPLFNGYISCFLMGYILSKINYNYKTVIGFLVAGLLGLTGSIVFNYIYSSSDGINLVTNYGYSLCHYVLATAIFVNSRYALSQKNLFNGIVSVLSKYSFGIYLVHAAVIDLILNYFMIDASPIVSSIYIFAVTVVVSLLVSIVLGKIKYVRKIIGI